VPTGQAHFGLKARSKTGDLAPWMPGRRWPAVSGEPTMRPVGGMALRAPPGWGNPFWGSWGREAHRGKLSMAAQLGGWGNEDGSWDRRSSTSVRGA
jgi:hypothetical protein